MRGTAGAVFYHFIWDTAPCRRTLALMPSSSRKLEVTIVISNMAEFDQEGQR